MRTTALGLIFGLSLLSPSTAEEKLPNVVLIFADDLGYGDLGCYGATKLKTPNIDRLAAEGRRFTDAHSASAVCTPSRYGLLTGEYPFRPNGGKGVWGPAPVTSPLLVDPDTQTIADLFKSSGYETAVFGKWHLGFKEGSNDWQAPLRPGPQDLGFDYYFGMPVVNSAPPYVYVENDKIVGSDPDDPIVHVGNRAKDRITPIPPIKPEEAQRSPNQFSGAIEAHKLFNDYEVGTTLTEKATGWIKERGDKPFFALFSTTNVHHPFTPAKRFQGSSECGVYGDFVHELDWIVGEVMKTLEAQGVADNTLVIFTSDNGGMFNLGGRAAAAKGHKINGDLLGSKFGIWEGGHRVPFIARWPGAIPAGSVSDQLLSSVDLLASFAALTGKKLTDAEKKDSINMLPALTGDPEKPLRDELFLVCRSHSHMSLRRGKWMYIPAKNDGGFTGSKPGQHAWGGPAVTKLVGTPNSDIDLETGTLKKSAAPAQLYDLESDRNQTKNVYHDYPAVVRELSEELQKAKAKVNPAPRRNRTQPSANYDKFNPLGDLRYSFESGKLEGWKVVDGEFGHAVTGVRSLKNWKDLPFARHGKFHPSTLVLDDGEALADSQTGILQSPTFTVSGEKAAFLVSGGFDKKDLYVALVDTGSGEALIKAGGGRDPQMRRVVWDISKWKGRKAHFQVVDRSTGGWGHLNVDDFSVGSDAEDTPGKPAAAAENTAQAVAKTPPRPATTKPNFVVIFADDLGYGDISCYNPNAAKTPHLEALAAEGFRSTDFFVPANVCSPSRAALLTGRYPMRCGMPVARNANIPKYKDYGFQPEELTIPELLAPKGYRSLMVGKWHMGLEIEGSHPIDAGFDEHLGIRSNFSEARGTDHNTLYRGKEVEARNLSFEALTARYTDEVVSFIEKNREHPFFIYFAHHIPHTPHLPSEEFKGSSKKGRYGDVIKELDHSTGRVRKALRDAGLDDNTIVVFTSDNGPTYHGSTAILNGVKYTTMEGGHRVPGIIRWPGQIPPGQTSDLTLTSMDLLPLFCGLAGAELPSDRKIDGQNILPILKGESDTSPHELLYYYNGTNLQAVREGEWKLHLPRTREDQPFWNKKPHGGRVFVTLEEPALFDLENDLGERKDVAAENPGVVARLQKHAETIRAELGDVRFKGSDQRAINLVDPQER